MRRWTLRRATRAMAVSRAPGDDRVARCTVAGLLACVLLSACDGRRESETADSPRRGAPAAAAAAVTEAPEGNAAAPSPAGYLITATSMAGVELGATLGDIRRAWPAARFERTSDGEGIALIEVTLAPGAALVLWAEEDDAHAPIDWSKRVGAIATWSPAFATGEGVRAGALVTDVVQRYGPVREVIQSEIESREYITFERQPAHLTFRLNYTGVFAEGERTTTVVAPGGAIHSIEISLP